MGFINTSNSKNSKNKTHKIDEITNDNKIKE